MVLYVFEIPKIACGKVIGISKTHHWWSEANRYRHGKAARAVSRAPWSKGTSFSFPAK